MLMLTAPVGSGGRRCEVSATESMPVAHSYSVSVDSISVDTVRVEPTSLTCPYCASPMDPRSFAVWPSQPRLITGQCGGCGRSLTLPSQWLSSPPLLTQRVAQSQ